MSRSVLLAAFVSLLCGCGSSDSEDSASSTSVDLSTEAATELSGTYAVELADGSVLMHVIRPDGSYAETTPDGTRLGSGKWRVENGRICFDPEGNSHEECFAGEAPAADGKFVIRGDDEAILASVHKVTPSPVQSAGEKDD